MEYRDQEMLELILRLDAHLKRRLAHKGWTDFLADEDEIDLTAYRLLHIGEAARKLSESLKARYPHIPWPAIYATRNVLSHAYLGVDAPMLWHTVKNDLNDLVDICRIELAKSDQ
jgi:uncharacterized protein with HEPN domain